MYKKSVSLLRGIFWFLLLNYHFWHYLLVKILELVFFFKEIWFRILAKVKFIIFGEKILNFHWYLFRIKEQKWPLWGGVKKVSRIIWMAPKGQVGFWNALLPRLEFWISLPWHGVLVLSTLCGITPQDLTANKKTQLNS